MAHVPTARQVALALPVPATHVPPVQSPATQFDLPSGKFDIVDQLACPLLALAASALHELTQGLRTSLQVPLDKQSASG